jgi:N-acetylglutamate synthase-like GNAT family acetyltransferase
MSENAMEMADIMETANAMEMTELDAAGLAGLAEALRRANLPIADLAHPGSGRVGQLFWRFAIGGVAIGYAGIEARGAEALLRSVVVDEAARGRNHGRRMVKAVVQRAAERGVRRLWLLTIDASDFFARMGFVRTAREHVPPSIAGLAEFTQLCPASAVCMAREIGA